MIALVILSISGLALANLQLSSIKGNAVSQRRTTAVSVAEQRIEQLKNTPFANIQAESATPVTASNLNFTRQVTVDPGPLPDTLIVSVIVTWLDGTRTYRVPITTIIGK
jgi:type IV pilus assembly protein PilV